VGIPPLPFHDLHWRANPATSASSTLPAAVASQLRTFHEHRRLHNLDCGFSAGTTGSISNSRQTSGDTVHSPQDVLRLKWRELLFEEARRIMAQYGTRSGCRFNKIGLISRSHTSPQPANVLSSHFLSRSASTSRTANSEHLLWAEFSCTQTSTFKSWSTRTVPLWTVYALLTMDMGRFCRKALMSALFICKPPL